MTVLEVILRVNKDGKRLNQSRESEMYQLPVKWGLELIPHHTIRRSKTMLKCGKDISEILALGSCTIQHNNQSVKVFC